MNIYFSSNQAIIGNYDSQNIMKGCGGDRFQERIKAFLAFTTRHNNEIGTIVFRFSNEVMFRFLARGWNVGGCFHQTHLNVGNGTSQRMLAQPSLKEYPASKLRGIFGGNLNSLCGLISF